MPPVEYLPSLRLVPSASRPFYEMDVLHDGRVLTVMSDDFSIRAALFLKSTPQWLGIGKGYRTYDELRVLLTPQRERRPLFLTRDPSLAARLREDNLSAAYYDPAHDRDGLELQSMLYRLADGATQGLYNQGSSLRACTG